MDLSSDNQPLKFQTSQVCIYSGQKENITAAPLFVDLDGVLGSLPCLKTSTSLAQQMVSPTLAAQQHLETCCPRTVSEHLLPDSYRPELCQEAC